MKKITQTNLVEDLKNPKTLLLDVRERLDFQNYNLGGLNIPPHEVGDNLDVLRNYETIIVACAMGAISEIVARYLQKKLPDKNIFHLEEGIG
jgi:rhodanese-related sulfurtransferase